MDQLSLVFTKSLPQSGRSVLRPGDWRIFLLCFYILAPFTESIDQLGRIIVSASKVPEQESNSSYTVQVDPFPSALSTIFKVVASRMHPPPPSQSPRARCIFAWVIYRWMVLEKLFFSSWRFRVFWLWVFE